MPLHVPQLRDVRAQKAAAVEARRREEEAELAAAKVVLEADKVKAAAKMAAAREQWLKTTKDNEARIAARRAAQVCVGPGCGVDCVTLFWSLLLM